MPEPVPHRSPSRKVLAACVDCKEEFDRVSQPVWVRGDDLVCNDCAGGDVEAVVQLRSYRSHADDSEPWVHEVDRKRRMVIP